MCFFSMYAQHSAKDCLYDLYKVLSTCHNKDTPLDSVVEVNLGNKVLYFMVNTESPRSFKYSDINSIYDGNGLSLVDRDDYMKFPAIIDDSDSFTYVREGPSKKYRVKG